MANFTTDFKNSLDFSQFDSHVDIHRERGIDNVNNALAQLPLIITLLKKVISDQSIIDTLFIENINKMGFSYRQAVNLLGKQVKQQIRMGQLPFFAQTPGWQDRWALALKNVDYTTHLLENFILIEQTPSLAIFVMPHLAVDPKRQNLDETATVNTIRKILHGLPCVVSQMTKAYSRKNYAVLHQNGVIDGGSKTETSSRSMDIKISVGDKEIFINAKMTEQSGGGQSGIINESKLIGKIFENNSNPRQYLLALLDGKHYSDTGAHAEVNTSSTSDRFIACTTLNIRNVVEHIMS